VIWMLYSSSCFWVHSTVEIEGLVPPECKSDMTLDDVGGSILCGGREKAASLAEDRVAIPFDFRPHKDS
jgi:hypothetical protein